jgi:hypothetical protein
MTTKENKLDEAVVTGGGETGQSKTADPVGGQATLPKSNKNSETMNKIDTSVTPGQGEEETDVANNTKATGDSSAANRASVAMKEDVAAIFNGEELSEEFKEKATVIFEAALTARVSEITEQLQAEFDTKLSEQVVEIQEGLEAQLDQYMSYVTEQWMEQNQVAIESSLKSEITESFIEDLKGLFEQHNIALPEEKVDMLEQTMSELVEVQSKLDEALTANMELSQKVNESLRADVLGEISEGLAATQAEKLVALSEGVTFESADSFRKKLEIVKENYFPATSKTNGTQSLLEEIQEEAEKPAAMMNSAVSAYASAISRTVKK